MFDKHSLASRFSFTLGQMAQVPSPDTTLRDAFVDVFPWLANFRIKRDGNSFRWLAENDFDPGLNTVFTMVILAEKQVRDWILEYIDQQEKSLA